MADLLPPVGSKALFAKRLQASSATIVQHCTALALVKCLRKLAEVVCVFRMVDIYLEEDEEAGQWRRRRSEVEREARRRVQYLSSESSLRFLMTNAGFFKHNQTRIIERGCSDSASLALPRILAGRCRSG